MTEQTDIYIRLTEDDTSEHEVVVDPSQIGELHQIIQVLVDLHPIWGLSIGVRDNDRSDDVQIGVLRRINQGFYDNLGNVLPGDEIVRRLNLLKQKNNQ